MTWKCILLAIVCIFCTKHTQSKRLYELVIESVHLHKGKDLDLVKVHMARMSKFNQTSIIFNASVTLLEDLPVDTTTVQVEAYELMNSNKYSMVTVRLGPPTNLCAAIKGVLGQRFYPYFAKSGNFPKECPFLKGDYYVRNYVADETMMPMYFPGERWRVDMMIRIAKKLRYKFSSYIFINRNI